ncbi:hypothetical protein BDZ97DRAFT_1817714 [Flammula alnicola]|nr:hypothetical protein BDZ97DRAFT_1817714 [Flammula alnicola]
MFRLSRLPRITPRFSPSNSRGLVSSVLLSRTWKNESIAELRNEAKLRGLSSNMAGTRQASTAIPTPKAPVVTFLDVKIPDLSHRQPLPPVQVPYVPDFWDSSSSPVETLQEESLPKLLVVAGADTHYAGGPSHNLLDMADIIADSPKIEEEKPKTERSDSFLDDIAEDLGLPPVKDIKNSLRKLF